MREGDSPASPYQLDPSPTGGSIIDGIEKGVKTPYFIKNLKFINSDLFWLI